MIKYIVVFLFIFGCSKNQGQWYIHFVDGSEIRITQPSMTDPANGCASRMYIVPTENILFSSTADKIKAKSSKVDGYTYRKGNSLFHVPFCHE